MKADELSEYGLEDADMAIKDADFVLNTVRKAFEL